MDYDARFKALLTLFFREFLELFFPEFAERIDWRRAPEFLDKELQSIVVESGPKTVDLLVKVWSREAPRSDSVERLCLIHVEVEARRSRDALGQRVSRYVNRIDETFDLPVVPIAVYLNVRGEGIGWQSRELTCWGHTIVSYHFPYIGLPALDGVKYTETSNPIALALSGLMNVSPQDRARIKGEAVWRIERLRLDVRRRAVLIQSVEAFTVLDEQQTRDYEELLKSPRFQKAREMQKTIYDEAEELGEKRGLEKGLKKGLTEGLMEGRREGRRELLREQLETKFGTLSSRSRRKFQQLGDEELDRLACDLLKAQKLSDLGL